MDACPYCGASVGRQAGSIGFPVHWRTECPENVGAADRRGSPVRHHTHPHREAAPGKRADDQPLSHPSANEVSNDG